MSVQGGQLFHRLTDLRYGTLLGDDEGDDHLPQILAQDADSAPEAGGGQEVGILRGDHFLNLPVIGVQIKIVFPEGEILLAAVEGETVPLLDHCESFLTADGREAPGGRLPQAEALAGGGDLL